MKEKVIMIDRHCCAGCDTCVRACPSGAMDLLGTHISVDELFNEVIKDRAFFEKSGGGVTVSGGEPTMQPDFIASFFQCMNEAGINTALDTCGLCSVKNLKKILPHTDIVLYDLKEIDPDKHYEFTGQDNQRIFDNLLFIRDYIMEMKPGTKLWIRTPLIPGTTATCENLTGIGTFLAQNLAGTISRWELCTFNNLCRDKYRRLGIEWRFSDTPLITERTLHELEDCAKRSGVDPDIVLGKGATRMELDHGDDRL
jgi:pyruvate formate lyase activating enzyme